MINFTFSQIYKIGVSGIISRKKILLNSSSTKNASDKKECSVVFRAKIIPIFCSYFLGLDLKGVMIDLVCCQLLLLKYSNLFLR